MSQAPQIDRDSVVSQSPDLVAAQMDGETVMMGIETGTYYGLDAIGSEIWALIAEPRRVGDLCALMVERFEVTPEQCEADVLAFLGDLASDGTIRVLEDPDG